MNALRRFLDSPLTELAVGLVLLAAGVLEIRDIVAIKLPGKGPLLPHAVALIGAALILRSLPGMFLGLEILDKAVKDVTLPRLLAPLDRIAHSHVADLCMGLILIAAGGIDLAGMIAAGPLPPLFGTTPAAIIFGLAPFANVFLVLYVGVKRLDRERPNRLMDRAMHNPWIRVLAGLILLGGGAAEFAVTLAGGRAFGHGLALPGGLAVFGLFAVLSGLPGIYLGLSALAGPKNGKD